MRLALCDAMFDKPNLTPKFVLLSVLQKPTGHSSSSKTITPAYQPRRIARFALPSNA